MALPGANPSGAYNQEAELAAIDKVLESFRRGSTDIVTKLSAEIGSAQTKLQQREREMKESLYADLAKMQVAGIIKSNEEAKKYMEAVQRDAQADKLKSEIEILQYISKESQKERDKKKKDLELERKILELRAEGNEEEAKQKEKELAIKKKKDKKEQELKNQAEENLAYEFGDILREHFSVMDASYDVQTLNQKRLEENLVKAMDGVKDAINDGLNAINNAISEYAKYQGSINARLQGVGSYADSVKTLSSVAFSPLLRAEDLYANLADLVGQGIVTNVEQRAMFATMKDNIAGTFDVTSDSLKRLIRIQQNDSTAARLGMEAYLTRFLNVYVENTEYLQSTFDTVSNSLLEASAMMHLNTAKGAAASAELEFVIQKWLGTLSGVGLSDSAAQSIADAIGQLGSGNIDALSSSDMQNLIVMAASKVGLSYGEMLNTGIDAKQANDLMLGVVEYLQEVGETGTNVIKSQLANVFGVTVSDLVAVSNLSDSALKTVHNDLLSYQNMYGELTSQFKELPGRLGISNILENLFSNLTYQTGMSIASNPVTYALWKITDMIQSVTNGIAVPMISVMGNAFDLNTTVENLMKLGIVGVSTLGNIGKIASGLGSIGDGSVLLKKLKVSEGDAKVKSFGGSSMTSSGRQSGSTTSETTLVGNTDGSTYSSEAENAASDDAQKKLDQKKEEYEDPVVQYLDEELRLADYLEDLGSKIDTIAGSQATMANLQAIIAGSQMMMVSDIAATYAAVNLLVELMQSSAQGPDAAPEAPVNPLETGFEYIDTLIRDRAQLPEISGDAIAEAIAQMGTITIAASSGSGGGGSKSKGSSSGASSNSSNTSGSGVGATAGASAAEAANATAATAGEAASAANSAAASASSAANGAVSAVEGATMASQAANASIDSMSAILLDMLAQSAKTETSMLEAVAPVGATLVNIDTTLLSTVAALSALNGVVVSGIESICDQFSTILEANAYVVDSAYTNYTDNISQNIDTTYSTITGDVANQVEVIKDMVSATTTADDAGNTVVNVDITAPDVKVDNTVNVINTPVEVNPEIINTPPVVQFDPTIDVQAPEVTVDSKVNVDVPQQDVTVDPEISVNPEIINTVPNVQVDNQIVNNPPEVNVENNIANEIPEIIVNNQIINTAPNINLVNNIVNDTPDVVVNLKNDIIYQPPQIINTTTFTPNIINNIPDVNVYPEIVNDLSEVQINPEIINTVPNVSVSVQTETPEIAPNIQVVEDITVQAPDVDVSPKVEITNTVPNVNVEPNIVNEVEIPEIAVNPEVMFTVPNIVVNNEIVNTVPDVVVNNDIVNTVPDVAVEATVVVPDAQSNKANKASNEQTEYDRYLTENGIINTIASTSNTPTRDVSDYLVEIDFADGFKLIVDNVSKIKDMMENSDQTSFDDADAEITGFTNYTFNK